jgi:hypothetical protein
MTAAREGREAKRRGKATTAREKQKQLRMGKKKKKIKRREEGEREWHSERNSKAD